MPLVYFEDAANDGKVGGKDNDVTGKKVRHLCWWKSDCSDGQKDACQNSKTTATNDSTSAPGWFSEPTSKCKEVIKQLQFCWYCDSHSKDADIYCWNPPGENVCYTLTYANIVFWASEIVRVHCIHQRLSC